MEEISKKTVSGAGFLIFREDTIGSKDPLMLALIRSDGKLDIPKGSIDSKENSLETAKRECFEECSIIIEDQHVMFSGEAYVHGPLEVFCAHTKQTPLITSNPVTGVLEHEDYSWVTKDEFCSRCLPYLIPSITHFYSSYYSLYNNT